MLSVCVSASSTDGTLITTAFYRSILGATSTADDATQLAIVKAASQWASDYVRFPLWAQVYSESLPAYGTRDLLVTGRPLVQVLRLLDSSSTADATEYCSTDYSVDFDAGMFRRRAGTWSPTNRVSYHLGPFIEPRTEADRLYTEYTAGYVVNGASTSDSIYSTAGIGGSTTTAETLPADIKLAVAMKAIVMSRSAQSIGIASKSIGDLSITYGAGANNAWTPGSGVTAESLLANYRSA